ncbi:MAG TPA: hypothetical protein VGC56_02380 [Allosphingosinicella sp.]|jgi:hypothetical protein
MRRLPLLAAFLLAACGQPVPKGNGGAETSQALPDIVTPEPVAVAIGELGPTLEACPAAGTTSHVEAGGKLSVRAAPFDNAPETGAVASGARFFVCTRSLDQKWFGVVYDEAGTLAARCGVGEPVASRRSYSGPCKSGWVSSALVKLTAGDPPAPADSNPVAPPAERQAVPKSG